MSRLRCAVLLLACAMPIAAQRDFLAVEESDQIREAQEPNERLKLYVKFAEQRLALLGQLFATQKPGRSALIHETLEDFTKIVEAIDTVADDALKRQLDVQPSMKMVADSEKKMLETLQKLDGIQAKDRQRFEFALKQAIETTRDSMEMSLEDLTERKAEVAAKDQRERKERESMSQPKDVEEKRTAEKKAADTEKKRKAPTLRRKGEVVPKQP